MTFGVGQLWPSPAVAQSHWSSPIEACRCLPPGHSALTGCHGVQLDLSSWGQPDQRWFNEIPQATRCHSFQQIIMKAVTSGRLRWVVSGDLWHGSLCADAISYVKAVAYDRMSGQPMKPKKYMAGTDLWLLSTRQSLFPRHWYPEDRGAGGVRQHILGWEPTYLLPDAPLEESLAALATDGAIVPPCNQTEKWLVSLSNVRGRWIFA